MARIVRCIVLLTVMSGVAGESWQAGCSMRNARAASHGCCAPTPERLEPSCCQTQPTLREGASLVAGSSLEHGEVAFEPLAAGGPESGVRPFAQQPPLIVLRI